jgi:hypothetical protein
MSLMVWQKACTACTAEVEGDDKRIAALSAVQEMLRLVRVDVVEAVKACLQHGCKLPDELLAKMGLASPTTASAVMAWDPDAAALLQKRLVHIDDSVTSALVGADSIHTASGSRLREWRKSLVRELSMTGEDLQQVIGCIAQPRHEAADASATETAAGSTEEEDDGFGDFGDADGADGTADAADRGSSDTAPAPTGTEEEEEDDGFGDFRDEDGTSPIRPEDSPDAQTLQPGTSPVWWKCESVSDEWASTPPKWFADALSCGQFGAALLALARLARSDRGGSDEPEWWKQLSSDCPAPAGLVDMLAVLRGLFGDDAEGEAFGAGVGEAWLRSVASLAGADDDGAAVSAARLDQRLVQAAARGQEGLAMAAAVQARAHLSWVLTVSLWSEGREAGLRFAQGLRQACRFVASSLKDAAAAVNTAADSAEAAGAQVKSFVRGSVTGNPVFVSKIRALGVASRVAVMLAWLEEQTAAGQLTGRGGASDLDPSDAMASLVSASNACGVICDGLNVLTAPSEMPEPFHEPILAFEALQLAVTRHSPAAAATPWTVEAIQSASAPWSGADDRVVAFVPPCLPLSTIDAASVGKGAAAAIKDASSRWGGLCAGSGVPMGSWRAASASTFTSSAAAPAKEMLSLCGMGFLAPLVASTPLESHFLEPVSVGMAWCMAPVANVHLLVLQEASGCDTATPAHEGAVALSTPHRGSSSHVPAAALVAAATLPGLRVESLRGPVLPPAPGAAASEDPSEQLQDRLEGLGVRGLGVVRSSRGRGASASTKWRAGSTEDPFADLF